MSYWNIGSHGNIYDDEDTGLDLSSAVDIKNLSNVCIFGTIESAADLDLYVSANGEDFYNAGKLIFDQQDDSYPKDFNIEITAGSRFLAIKPNTDVKATLSIMAKP